MQCFIIGDFLELSNWYLMYSYSYKYNFLLSAAATPFTHPFL